MTTISRATGSGATSSRAGKERECLREQALRECAACRARPRMYDGGSPHRVVVVCHTCWANVERPWLGYDGVDSAIGEWNRRQAELSGIRMQHCGTCRLWGSPSEEDEPHRRCLRQGIRFWEMRTYRHMGFECPSYSPQEGER